jgi:HAD superfamily hydrolase (TIGR01509 family)
VLLFDLSEVFIRGMKGVERYLAPLVGRSHDEIDQAFMKEWPERLFTGRQTEEDWLRALISENNWPVDVETIKALLRKNMLETVPETADLLPQLAPQAELMLLSDHVREWMDDIRHHHRFLDHFQELFFSYDIGHTKAKPEAFRHVMRRIKVPSSSVLFIDDSPRNVAQARAVGIPSVIFTSAQELCRDLSARGFQLAGPGRSLG